VIAIGDRRGFDEIGDPAAREWAWKRIETARTSVADANELGDMEPSARRSG